MPPKYARGLGKVKPDFLVHIPGEVDNLVAMEVKPINAGFNGIFEDCEKLNKFINLAGYKKPMYIYGDANEEYLHRLRQELLLRQLFLQDMSLLWHRRCGEGLIEIKVTILGLYRQGYKALLCTL